MNRVIIYAVSAIALLFQHTIHSQNFSISGNLSDLSDTAMVRLYDTEDNTVIDSSLVKDHTFLLEGKLPKVPRSMVLHVQDKDFNAMEYLYIGNENILIRGTLVDFPLNLVFSGSQFQEVKSKLDKQLLTLVKKQQEKAGEIKSLYESGRWNDSIQERYVGRNGIMNKIEDEKRTVEKKFIKENANAHYSLYLLNLYKSNFYTDKELLAAYKNINKKLRNTDEAKAIKTYLDHPRLKIGDHYRDFKAMDKKGEMVSFDRFFKGRYILLDFSTPTCGNSMNSRAMLQELRKEFPEKLEIISYYTENNKDHFEFFSNPENYPWTFLWNNDGNFNETILKYRVGGTPTFFIFQPDGKILDTWMGLDENTKDRIKKRIEP